MNKSVFTFILFCLLSRLNAQTLTGTQTERLFKTSQLWGHITYFHPYPQYKKIPLDSAYAAMIPQLLKVKNDTQFTEILNQWLGVLNDPTTKAEILSQQINKRFNANFHTLNDVGFITLSGETSNFNVVLEKLKPLTDSISQAKALIIDLREITENGKGDIDFNSYLKFVGFDRKLFSGTISTNAYRSVRHSGFVSEDESPSGEYNTSFNYNPANLIVGERTSDIPIAFIVSEKTIIPDIVGALQASGKAIIISDRPILDNSNTISYRLNDNINVRLRTKEYVFYDYKADFIIENENIIEKTLQVINKGVIRNEAKSIKQADLIIQKRVKYENKLYPNLGNRALSAAKVYSVINYFFPNKNIMTVDWDSVMKISLPKILLAKDSAEYQLAIASFYSNLQDGHGSISGLLMSPIFFEGSSFAPIAGEVIENKFVVTVILNDSLANLKGVQKGDIIKQINGREVLELVKRLKKYRSYSNDATGNYYASRLICTGKENSEGVFTIQKKDGRIVDVKLPYKYSRDEYWSKKSGYANLPMIRFVTPEIGYVDLDRLKATKVDSMFEVFKNTKAIIFDMRGYPDGTAWDITPRLTNQKNVAAAKYTRLEVDSPNVLENGSDISNKLKWYSFIQNLPNPSEKWKYTGKTVMLINEHTQSQAEHTGLFFKAANNTVLVGSQTAGANGDVTRFKIPGNMLLTFSGQTVWYPDGKPLQKVGLKPDIFIKPTIKGIQNGKDEVLERAILYLKTNK